MGQRLARSFSGAAFTLLALTRAACFPSDNPVNPDAASDATSDVAPDAASFQCSFAAAGPGNLASFYSVYDHATLHSGLIVGLRGDAATSVEVSLDGGAFAPADVTTAGVWRFALPTPPWPLGSSHTVAIRPRDASNAEGATTTITVRKGKNLDLNGDGFSDLVVGARGAGTAGRVYLYFSDSHCGIDGNPQIVLHGTIDGEAGVSDFGVSLAVDDFDGDGYGDLAVGAYAPSATGKVYLFKSDHSPKAINVSSAAQAGTVLTSTQKFDQFGFAIAAGDVTGDGYADLVVGAPTSASGADIYGNVRVFHSSGPGGITATTPSTTVTGSSLSFKFGFSVAVGDVNGDGHGDVLVGSIDDTGGGKAYVFHASPSGTGLTATSSAAADTTIVGAADERLGVATAVGDVNGDGYADVVFGANLADGGNGRAYVFQSSGATGIAATNPSTATTTIVGESASGTGVSVALGDLNGDGFDDLVVGGSLYATTGRVYLFPSSGSGGIVATTPASTITGTSANGRFGSAVFIAEMSGDGQPDLVVGEEWYSNQTGRAYVFATKNGAIATDGPAELGARNTFTGEATTNRFGSAIH